MQSEALYENGQIKWLTEKPPQYSARIMSRYFNVCTSVMINKGKVCLQMQQIITCWDKFVVRLQTSYA